MKRFRKNNLRSKKSWYLNPLFLQWLTFGSVAIGGISHWYLVDRPSTHLTNEQAAQAKEERNELGRRLQDADLNTKNLETSIANLSAQVSLANATVDKATYEKVKFVDELLDSMRPIYSFTVDKDFEWSDSTLLARFNVKNLGPRPFVFTTGYDYILKNRTEKRLTDLLKGKLSASIIGNGLVAPGETITGFLRIRSSTTLQNVDIAEVNISIHAISNINKGSKSYALLRSAYNDAYINPRLEKTSTFASTFTR